MFDRMRERVRTRQYVVSVHGEEEMDDDDLTIFNIEHSILTGTVVARQANGSIEFKGKLPQIRNASW